MGSILKILVYVSSLFPLSFSVVFSFLTICSPDLCIVYVTINHILWFVEILFLTQTKCCLMIEHMQGAV